MEAARTFLGHLAGVSWTALALALVFHLGKVATTAQAWRNIVASAYPASPIRWRGIFGAYAAGAGIGAFMPSRSGDLVKLYLAKRQVRGSSYATLAATLFVESLFDFLVAVVLLAAAVRLGLVPGLETIPGPDASWVFGHPGESAAIGVALLLGTAFVALRLGHHVLALRGRVVQGLAVLGDWRLYLRRVVAWQLLNWLLRLAALYWFLRAFGLVADLHNALVVQIAQNASALVPVTPSGVGTEQALVVFSFAGTLPTTEVLSFSVGMKVALTTVNVLLGFAALALMLRTLRWRRLLRGAAGPSGAP